MKRLPDSELEIMLIIWDLDRPVTRFDIEERMDADRKLSPTTILSFLSRLQEKGFIEVTKNGKSNIYTALIDKQTYTKAESRNVLKKLYMTEIIFQKRICRVWKSICTKRGMKNEW